MNAFLAASAVVGWTLLASSTGVRAGSSGEITPYMKNEVRRLALTVNIEADRISIGELLERVTIINDWPAYDLLRFRRVRALRLTEKPVPVGKQTDFELIDSAGTILSSHGFTDVGFNAEELMARRMARVQN